MASISTREPTDALTGQLVPEMWALEVIDAVRSNLVCVNTVDTHWAKYLIKGDILNVPVLSSLSTANVSVTTDNIANINATVTSTAQTVTIDTWKECLAQIDDNTRNQTMIGDLVGKIKSRCIYEISKAIDTDVNALFASLGSAYANTDGATFSDDTMLAMMETLDEADVPRENRSLVIDPSTIADIYKIDKFVRMDYVKEAVIPTGQIGKMYGIPVFITNNLTDVGTGNAGALLHKEAIALIMQEKSHVEVYRRPELHSTIVCVDAIWGCDIVRDTFGVPFYTRSA